MIVKNDLRILLTLGAVMCFPACCREPAPSKAEITPVIHDVIVKSPPADALKTLKLVGAAQIETVNVEVLDIGKCAQGDLERPGSRGTYWPVKYRATIDYSTRKSSESILDKGTHHTDTLERECRVWKDSSGKWRTDIALPL